MTAAEVRAALSRPWRHGEALDLRGATLHQRLDLRDLPLGGLDARGATFAAGIDARGARFNGLAWFHGARLAGPCDFAGAVFANDARFDEARFDDALFAGAEFRGTACFRGAQMRSGDLGAITCYGNLDLGALRCTGALRLTGAECLGGLWAPDCALPAETDLSETQIHGRLWLRGARRGTALLAERDFALTFGYCTV